jgi:hypothetical protein
MMQKRALLIIFYLSVNLLFGQDFTELYGDYLGQTPPCDTAVVFAPGIVSTDDLEHSPAMFTPDGNEVYWITSRPPGPDNNKWAAWELSMKRVNNRWSKPFVFPYKIWALSPDGNQAYFTENKDIWVIEREGDNWSEPKCLNLVTQYPELQTAYISSISRNGTLYFTAYLEGLKNNYGIYRSKLINGKYAKPEALPNSINMTNVLNWTPFIEPDENYIIFSSDREGQFGDGDLYISYHDISSDTWSEPINMGDKINTKAQERLPGVSPDGKYLFFTRWISKNNHDVYWVSAEIINRLKVKEDSLK